MSAQQMAEDGGGDAGTGANAAPLGPEARQVGEQGGVRAEDVPEHSGRGVALGAESGGASLALENVPGVPQISRERDERGGEQHAQWKILDQHEQAVAFHEVSLEGRGAAGGMGVMVLH